MKRRTGNLPGPSASGQEARGHQTAAQPGGRVVHMPPNGGPSEPSPRSTRLTMSQHAQNLLRFLNEDRAQQKFCDVSVCVGGNLYKAHKIVLAHGSSYFHAELSKNPGMTSVTLDHVDHSVFQHLLSFMYTSECFVAETDLAPLIKAASFLDMMDVLKLLREEGGHSTRQDGRRGSPEVEATSSDSPAVDTDTQSTTDDQCPNGNLRRCPDSSQCEGQADVHQEALAKNDKSATTRRSTRSRRMPTKYQRMNSEHSAAEDHLRKQFDGADDKVEGTAAATAEVKEPSQPLPEEGPVDEVQDEGNLNETVKRKKMCRINKQGSGSVGRSKQADGENPGAAAGSSAQSLVYPEGLAPIIIASSSKKILQCPKCEKVFDRAGGHRAGICSLSSSIFPVVFIGVSMDPCLTGKSIIFKKDKFVIITTISAMLTQ